MKTETATTQELEQTYSKVLSLLHEADPQSELNPYSDPDLENIVKTEGEILNSRLGGYDVIEVQTTEMLHKLLGNFHSKMEYAASIGQAIAEELAKREA